MSAPKGYTLEYDIKGEPRKLRCGSQQLQDFRNSRRKKAVMLAGEIGSKRVCELIRCSSRSVRDWTRKWMQGGFAALFEKSRRPKRINWLERRKIDQLLDIRERQGYGCSKIAFDVGCSSSTVHKYLKVHGQNRPTGRRSRFRSFERKHANTLWQMDYTMLAKDLWVLQVVDDHSRFIIGARVMSGPEVNPTIQLLQECFSDYGMPEQFLTDHGTQFYPVKGGVCDFDRFCEEFNVQHILESIAHPQTLGKTEQRHNMMKNYLDQVLPDLHFASRDEVQEAVARWVQHHNFDSPHEGWITYRFGDLVKKKRIHFLPFLRFVNHRK
jgi:putative transposase